MTETPEQPLPIHIGFIMDGNGRWAAEQKLPRTAGHKKGAEVARTVIEHAHKRGIKVVTLYAFSTENWKRPKAEVKTLLDIFRKYMNEDIRELNRRGLDAAIIGKAWYAGKIDLAEAVRDAGCQN